MRAQRATYGRNLAILRRLEAGERAADLAREYGLSRTRVAQIKEAWAWREKWRGHFEGILTEYPLEFALLNLRRVAVQLKVLLEP